MSDSESGIFMTAEQLYTNYDEVFYKNYDINVIHQNQTYEKLKGIRKYINQQRTIQFNTDIFTYEFRFDNDAKFWIEDLPYYNKEKVKVEFVYKDKDPTQTPDGHTQTLGGRKRKRRSNKRRSNKRRSNKRRSNKRRGSRRR